MTQTTPPVIVVDSPVTKDLIGAYLFLRRGVGIIGLALPFVLVFGHDITAGTLVWPESISSYYYTDMRNVLVGSMCAIGVFLFCYRYDVLDNILSNLAGGCAIVVALFPTGAVHPSPVGVVVSVIHVAAAVVLFALLAAFCLILFPRGDPLAVGAPTPRKSSRNRIYRVCGALILVAMALAGVLGSPLVSAAVRDRIHPLLWCEWVAVTAFGFAWLVKGQTILRD